MGDRRIGFHAKGGSIRFRNARIDDLKPLPKSAWPLRTLYNDDFCDNWNDGQQGCDGSVYFIETPDRGCWGWSCPPFGLPNDISIEAVGRVLPNKPNDIGSWGLHIMATNKLGLAIWINNKGELWIEPSVFTEGKFPKFRPAFAPVPIPSYKGNGQFNTLRVVLNQGRMKIFVNSVPIGDTLTFDWLQDVRETLKGIDCGLGSVRSESSRSSSVPTNPSRPGQGSWISLFNCLERTARLGFDRFWPIIPDSSLISLVAARTGCRL